MGKAADLLRRGIAATRAGRKREAEQLLRQVIALGPNNEWAWFWLSAVVEGIEAQRECLHRALEINPDNGYARSGLAFLSRLRPGLEWQAEDAPWTDGVDERVMGGGESPRRCPRCGTINPGWAYTCSRCGTVLQTIDLVKVVQQEERIYSRTSAGLSVVEAWASAIVLRGSAAFGPEVELASWGRALSAFMTGGLFFIFLRGVIPGLVWALAMRRAPLLSMLQDLPALLADGGLTVGGIWVGALVLSFLLFPPARLMGGAGGFRVHFHLLSVAVSAWMFITSVLVFLLFVLALVLPASADREVVLFGLTLVAVFLSLSYLLVLLTQALGMAHRIAGIPALFLVMVGLGGLAAGAVVLGTPLQDVSRVVLRMVMGETVLLLIR